MSTVKIYGSEGYPNAQKIPHSEPTHPYHALFVILMEALDQAENGKGKERHADDKPFLQQPICEGGRAFGVGCLNYQAWKKTREAMKLALMENGPARYRTEILGAIVYNAAALIIVDETNPQI